MAVKQIIWNSKMVEEASDKIQDGFLLPRINNPFFESIIGLRRSGLTFEYTDEEITEYMKCKMDIHYFAENHCYIKGEFGQPVKINLRDYQTEILDNFTNHRFNILMASRQVGKSILASITIIHFIIFNNNKNCLVAANNLGTATEIVDKIKEIYQRLPFFLQQGIKNWAQKAVILSNKSKIKGFATTKTSSIGQTGDLLYLDEFAHIEETIVNKFYKSTFPTIANIANSKVIITSTPDGMNLFHKLLTDGERPEGDPLKNNFKACRVYWWQVPERFKTIIRLNNTGISTSKTLTSEQILSYLQNKYPNNIVKSSFDDEIKKEIISVLNNDFCSEMDILKEEINGIRLVEISEITTWKKEAIKDIGGEEAFNQEYDLKFINATRSLLDESIVDNLLNNKKEYQYEEIYELGRRLNFSYADLKWIVNEDVWSPIMRNRIKGVMSIDISEGLGQDYSVINIFKISPKPLEVIDINKGSYKSLSDFFCLEQFATYRSNIISVKQLAELFYTLAFEYFNYENFKVVLELNNYGNEFLAHLPNVFEGNNNYGSSIFFRYKHRIDATEEKIGLKVGENKNILVKDYQDAMYSKSFKITNEQNIREITTFVKHITSAGNVKYAADGGSNDDFVMTMVNASSIFQKHSFKEMVEDYANDMVDKEMITYFNKILNNIDFTESADYTSIININRQRRFINQYKKNVDNEKGNWFGF